MTTTIDTEAGIFLNLWALLTQATDQGIDFPETALVLTQADPAEGVTVDQVWDQLGLLLRDNLAAFRTDARTGERWWRSTH